MPTTRTHATLRIWPREPGFGTAAAVSEVLGIAPTAAHEAGEAKSDRDSRTWGNAMWSLQSDLPWDRPLSDHVEQLCQAVESHKEGLLRLAQDGYWLDCFCFVEVENGNGGVLLPPDTLRRLGNLRVVELDLDIYAHGDEAGLIA